MAGPRPVCLSASALGGDVCPCALAVAAAAQLLFVCSGKPPQPPVATAVWVRDAPGKLPARNPAPIPPPRRWVRLCGEQGLPARGVAPVGARAAWRVPLTAPPGWGGAGGGHRLPGTIPGGEGGSILQPEVGTAAPRAEAGGPPARLPPEPTRHGGPEHCEVTRGCRALSRHT